MARPSYKIGYLNKGGMRRFNPSKTIPPDTIIIPETDDAYYEDGKLKDDFQSVEVYSEPVGKAST